MSEPASNEAADHDPAAALEAEVDAAIAVFGGDVRGALTASLLANAFLEAEIEHLIARVSRGFARGRVRRQRGASGNTQAADAGKTDDTAP